jgi:hypothetical protein
VELDWALKYFALLIVSSLHNGKIIVIIIIIIIVMVPFLAEDGETHSSGLRVLGQWASPVGCTVNN